MATEKWLICLDEAEGKVCEGCNKEFSGEPCEPSDCYILAKLSECKAVDAVEVVRCKDCKHYVWDEFDFCHCCMHLCRYVKPDFGCIDGERKDNG